MKEIPLSQGKVAIVDDEDYEELLKFKWSARRDPNTYYAVSHTLTACRKRRGIRMHRVIIAPPIGMEIDHINGNGLDNRKENLRIVTRRQNSQNKHTPKTSHFPGVNWDKSRGKWATRIKVNKNFYSLGRYGNEETAARVYQFACQWIDGDGIIEPGPEQGTF